MKRIKIVFIGAVKFSASTLNAVISSRFEVAGVITKKQSAFNSDFCDLSSIAQKSNIPFIYATNINHSDNIEWVKALKPDVIYCFGWSNLIKEEMLNIAPLGVIGYHPALLPWNRGRHPIIWTIALGLKETGSSFFFMDEGADTGDILSQKKIQIDQEDNAQTLYDKLTATAIEQIREFTLQLQSGNYQRIKQQLNEGNSWRKRTKDDGKIDFRMTATWIVNLVKALTVPYAGAHLEFQSMDIKIWEAEEGGYAPENIEPGSILDIIGSKIKVKCAGGSVWLTRHDFINLPHKGEYLL